MILFLMLTIIKTVKNKDFKKMFLNTQSWPQILQCSHCSPSCLKIVCPVTHTKICKHRVKPKKPKHTLDEVTEYISTN